MPVLLLQLEWFWVDAEHLWTQDMQRSGQDCALMARLCSAQETLLHTPRDWATDLLHAAEQLEWDWPPAACAS